MRARNKINCLNLIRVQLIAQKSHYLYLLSFLDVKNELFSLVEVFCCLLNMPFRLRPSIKQLRDLFSFWRAGARFRLRGVLLEIWKHGKDHLDLEDWALAKYGICCVCKSYCLLSCSVSFHRSHRLWCSVTITSERSDQRRDEMRMGLQCHQLEVCIRDESAYC